MPEKEKENESRFYYIDYSTFELPEEIQASSVMEAEEIVNEYIRTNGVEFTVEEIEE